MSRIIGYFYELGRAECELLKQGLVCARQLRHARPVGISLEDLGRHLEADAREGERLTIGGERQAAVGRVRDERLDPAADRSDPDRIAPAVFGDEINLLAVGRPDQLPGPAVEASRDLP
jgi:hypothetical protein